MKRRTRYALLVLCAAAGLAAGAAAWLLCTTGGARWLLEKVSHLAPVHIQAEKIEGRLWGELRVQGLQVSLPAFRADIDDLRIEWSPLELLVGSLSLDRLETSGVRIKDLRRESTGTSEPGWPVVTGFLTWISVRVGRLRAEDITYQRLQQQPLELPDLSARLAWHRGKLLFNDLAVRMPGGRIEGSLAAGFVHPLLRLDFSLFPARPMRGLDRFSLSLDLRHGSKTPNVMAGPAEVTAFSGRHVRAKVGADLGISRTSVSVNNLQAVFPPSQGTVSGDAEIGFSTKKPEVRASFRFFAIDLFPWTGVPTDLSGTLHASGNPDRYEGGATISNKGSPPATATVSAFFQGTAEEVRLTIDKGTWLKGSLSGSAWARWAPQNSVTSSVRIRGIDTSAFGHGLSGSIGLDLSARLRRPRAIWQGVVSARLVQSRLNGKPLSGSLDAAMRNDGFHLKRLTLKGPGASINASGGLNNGLAYHFSVSDLGSLVPDSTGTVRANGLVRLHKGRWSGKIDLSAASIFLNRTSADRLNISAHVAGDALHSFGIDASLRDFASGGRRLDTATLTAGGTAAEHTLELSLRSGQGTLQAALAGGLNGGNVWQGKIIRLAGADAVGPWHSESPANLAASLKSISLSRLVLFAPGGERMELEGSALIPPRSGAVHAQWAELNLARVRTWISGLVISGSATGEIDSRWGNDRPARFKAALRSSITITVDGAAIGIQDVRFNGEWNEKGLHAGAEVVLLSGGRATADTTSSDPARLGLPDRAAIDVAWEDVSAAPFRASMPADLSLEGTLSGTVKGRLLPGRRLDLSGNVSVDNGSLNRIIQKVRISAAIKTGSLAWTWQGDALKGSLSLDLAEHGRLHAGFEIPLPARLPLSFDSQGLVHLFARGRIREQGVLSLFFPGLVQESHGTVDVNLRVSGTIGAPRLNGTVALSDAGAYFPAGGITIAGLKATVAFDGDTVTITGFEARSGPGHISGNASIIIRDWVPVRFRGTVTGEKFQAVYLPDLRVLCSPDIKFSGTPDDITVRGDIKVPELLAYGAPEEGPVRPSEDVVLARGREQTKPGRPLRVDLHVRVVLGDSVLVKAEGADVRLTGSITVSTGKKDRQVLGTGEISVAKGTYSAYGVGLTIERGRILFAGGPVENPALDVLALRTVGDVKAGVLVTGTVKAPLVKLYSEPSMPDADVLSYIVLGHPLGEDQQHSSALVLAAGALLSAGQSVVLQDQLKQRLGIDTIDIQTGSGETGRSLVTIGKYLSPKLYVSYGRSLFSDENVFRLRYSLSKRWEVETQRGEASGIDLYYKVDFD